MSEIADLALRCIAALAAVYAFYLAAGTKWPTSYYLLDDVVGSFAARTAGSFALFRFAPLFVASVCAMGYLPGVGDRVVVASGIAAGHLAISIFRINPFTNPGPRRARSWWCWQAAIVLTSLILISVAAVVAPKLGQALPQWRDIIAAFVTAILVVVGGALLQHSTSAHRGVDKLAIDRSRRKYESLVSEIALSYAVDRTFALALVVAEDLQRPSWFRIVERRAARAGMARTVGLGQAVSDWFITDKEGIDALLGSIGDITLHGSLSRAKMAAAAERCNEGDGYVEFVLHVFDYLRHGMSQTELLDRDGNPLIIASDPLLMHGAWRVEGDVGPSVRRLVIQDPSTSATIDLELEPRPRNRRFWTATIPIEWSRFAVIPNGSMVDSRSQIDIFPHI